MKFMKVLGTSTMQQLLLEQEVKLLRTFVSVANIHSGHLAANSRVAA